MTMRTRAWLGSALLLAACGRSPNTPARPPVAATPVVLATGETVTAPGTDLSISLLSTYVLGPAAAECIAYARCNFSPSVVLRVEVPGLAPQNRGAHIPNPMGGDVFSYGGYDVRVRGFDPEWNERSPRDASAYKVLLSVSRE
jgi:hypothetical protein